MHVICQKDHLAAPHPLFYSGALRQSQLKKQQHPDSGLYLHDYVNNSTERNQTIIHTVPRKDNILFTLNYLLLVVC